MHCRFLLLIMLTVLGAPMRALAVPVAFEDAHTLNLSNAVMFIEDADNSQTIDSVRQADIRWQQNSERIFNRGYNDSTWWLKLSLRNNLGVSTHKLLEIGYAVLDYVDVHIVTNGKV